MNVLFLDIDGVLNKEWWIRGKPTDNYGVLFDPKCVANLEKIIARTSADIVISSSWKMFMGLSGLQAMWKERGLPGKVIDVTPDVMCDKLLIDQEFNNGDILYNKGCEIKGWLSKYGDDVSHYAIIDDMDDILPEQKSHYIQTDPSVGITKFNAECVIRILNS